MISFMRVIATVIILLALACAAPAQQPPGVAGGTDVAARVGDRAITVGELDQRWRTTAPAEQAQALQQVYEGRRQALESIVADMLIERAAKASGMDQEKYAEAEVARRLGAQFDDDLNVFELKSFGLVDVSASQEVRRGLHVFVGVENLTDVDYDVGRTPIRTIGWPRTVRIGIRVFLP